jgi:microcystin-dependent protein
MKIDSDFLRLARRVKDMEGLTGYTKGVDASSSSDAESQMTAGVIMMWPVSEPPSGWLLCNGAAVSRSDYGALFVVIGTAYGSGDGSSTFNLPDLKGRVAVGYSDSDTTFDAIGETGGEKTHQLTAAELPIHAHTIGHSHSSGTAQSAGAHTHTTSGTAASNGAHTHNVANGSYRVGSGSGSTYNYFTNDGSTSPQNSDSAGTHTHTTNGTAASSGAHTHTVDIPSFSGNSGNAGSGTAHNNMPPFLVLNYIIKT